MDLYQKRWKRMRISILTLFCLVSVQGICGAADYTWTGGGTDSGWTNPSNWSLGTGYPGSGTGTDTVTIPHLSAGEYPDVPSSVFLKSLTVQSGAQMTVSAPGTRVSVSSVDISGTLTVSDGDFFVHTLTVQDGGIAEIDGGQLDIVSSSETGAPGFLLNRGELRLSSGDIYILGGGAISNQGTIDWKLGSIRLSPEVTDIFTFNNEGLIAVGSGLTGKILADCSFTNTSAGTVRMLSDGENALLAIQSNSANSQFINKGMVSGTGIFDFQPATQVFLNDGDSAVKGSIAPDDGDSLADSYGTLEIRGRFQQTENGQISIEITENASDVLRIGGSTQLAGDLNITGYATGGTFAATYPVVEYGVRSGAFSSVNFSDVPENYAFTAAYADNTTPQSVNISVTSTLPVTRTWAGTVSRNWWLAENWVDSGIPEDGDIVIIPAGTAYNPIFSGINTFQKIDIQGNLEIGVESHLITSEFIVRGGEVLNMGRLEWGYFNSILPVTSPRTDDAPVFISGVVINQGVLNWYEGNIELSGDKEKTGLLINRNDMTIGQSASDGASTDTPVLEIYGPGLFELSSQPDGDGDSYVRLQALELVTGAETLFSVKSGTAEGRGHICVNGFFHWSGGVLEGAAEPPVTGGRPEILINGSGRIFSNDFKKLFGRDLIAGGGSTTGAAIVTVENGSFYLGNESVFEVSAGATLRVDNNASAGMSVFNYDLTGVQLINYGNVTGNGKLAFIPPDDGTSTSLPPIFDNAGTISPGLSPGQLIIEVNEYDNSESTLAVDIVQDSLGNIISDELVIQTPLSDFPPVITLGGTLNITIDPDMLSKLTEGDEFRIITFDPALTSLPAPPFGQIFLNGKTMTSGEYFTVRYESGGVKLVVSEVISEFSIGLTISPSGSGRVLIEEEGDGETGTTGLTFTCPDDCVDSDTECNSGFCKKYFAPGARLKLTATPGSGYLFDTWDGEVESTSDPKIVYVDMAADQSVTARFEISQPLPDRDGDGTPDTQDGCPDDPRKTSPGACGCGVADTDSDGDETPDCNDECPADPNKTAPGQCGCGVADTDSDGDETPDCNDECPDDPDKTSPGACGCGVADTDSDGDATPDCNDRCPDDPDKTEPGQCGCGLSDADSDGDGFSDCRDQCPDDPGKTLPGQCGCGVADTDTDGDGTADCNDKCPDDPNKTFPGQCGCGVVDTDSDGDGTPDCFDKCPNDADKTEPGQCGCGVADADSDGDGTPDCSDKCPNDADKTEPGQCGCGIADTDSDGDGVADCESEAVSGIPVPISPENGETVAEDSVTLVAQVDLGSTVDGPMEIYWWWRPVDKKCTVSSETTEAYRGLAELRISGLRDGLQYAWQVGVKDPASGETLISDEVFFTVGVQVEVPFSVDAGTALSNYRMYSFSLWPEDADAADLLGDAVGEYDTKFFKIGTYDPEQSRYVEYDSGAITIVPGQAYWFLARNGLEASIRGIKVSVAENIHVHLRYDETREKGWNMIAPPNDGDYFRKDIQVIAYTETSDGSFEAEPGFETPVPLSALEADNPWLDLVLWKWKGGRYVSMTPDDAAAVLLRNRGYWVNARRGNICLVFPGSARKDLSESEDTLATMMRRGGEWMGRHLTPDAAVADSGETPPMPIGYSGSGASGTGGGVDSGGGGCFIDTVNP